MDEAILDRDAWQLGNRRAILKRTILNDVSSLLSLIINNLFLSSIFLQFLFFAAEDLQNPVGGPT